MANYVIRKSMRVVRECRRCRAVGIPFINECVECLDKIRALHEGVYGYWGEDDPDCKGVPWVGESKNSARARAVPVLKWEGEVKVARLIDHVCSSDVVPMIDRILSSPSVPYGGVPGVRRLKKKASPSVAAQEMEMVA